MYKDPYIDLVCVYKYIYIYRERERERENHYILHINIS